MPEQGTWEVRFRRWKYSSLFILKCCVSILKIPGSGSGSFYTFQGTFFYRSLRHAEDSGSTPNDCRLMNCRSLLILLMHCISVTLAQGRQEERNYDKIVAGRISDEGLPSGIRSFSFGYSNGRLLAFAGWLTDSERDFSFSPHVFCSRPRRRERSLGPC